MHGPRHRQVLDIKQKEESREIKLAANKSCFAKINRPETK